MKTILRRAAPLFVPVLVWLAFFIAFEPNNYFGLKSSASSTQGRRWSAAARATGPSKPLGPGRAHSCCNTRV